MGQISQRMTASKSPRIRKNRPRRPRPRPRPITEYVVHYLPTCKEVKKQVRTQVQEWRWPGGEVNKAVVIPSLEVGIDWAPGSTTEPPNWHGGVHPTGQAAGREHWRWPTRKQAVLHEDARQWSSAAEMQKVWRAAERRPSTQRGAQPLNQSPSSLELRRNGKWSSAEAGRAFHPIIVLF